MPQIEKDFYKQLPNYLKHFLIALSISALIAIILEKGFYVMLYGFWGSFFTFINYLIVIIFTIHISFNFAIAPNRLLFFRKNPIDLLLLFPLLLSFVNIKTTALLVIIRMVGEGIKLFFTSLFFNKFFARLQKHPAQLTALSFASAIFIGALLLTFPAATSDHIGASIIDSLFTSCSATCVTGLIVQDTPVYWTKFGQIVILMLIQIGGLGIMTLSTFFALFFGAKMGLRQRSAMQDIMDESNFTNLISVIKYIIKMTLVVELVGIILLFLHWIVEFKNFSDALYFAIFHSISAFCNAGFALFSNNLEGYANNIMINFVITTLIIIGGIGFTVISDILNKENFQIGFRRSIRYWSVHTKLVLSVTGILILAGTAIIFFNEFDNNGTLMPFNIPQKLMVSYFQSVTLRTAGFNTIPIGNFKNVTLLMMIIFMFIGASPGSTGGGIKTSTFALLLLSIKKMLTGTKEVELFNRTIPANLVYKSVAIAMISFIILTIMLLFIVSFQPQPFMELLFETMSAFGTVGLSTGVTSQLNTTGKIIITILMYVGRIGPLTLAMAVGEQVVEKARRFPSAKVLVG